MRGVADRERIRRLMEAFGDAASQSVRVYLVGGTTAVLLGWRGTTIEVDFVMRPEDDALLRAIPSLKEKLQVNVETASPADFIPVPAGWEDRGAFIAQVRRVAVYHFDLYAQALAKIERGHQQDRADVREMLGRGLIDSAPGAGVLRADGARVVPPPGDPRAQLSPGGRGSTRALSASGGAPDANARRRSSGRGRAATYPLTLAKYRTSGSVAKSSS